MLSAVVLAAIGLVLIESAFAPVPDPRLVLAAIFTADKKPGAGSVSPVPGIPEDFQLLPGETDLPFTRILDSRRRASISGASTVPEGQGPR